jgi:hypothetical protein
MNTDGKGESVLPLRGEFDRGAKFRRKSGLHKNNCDG